MMHFRGLYRVWATAAVFAGLALPAGGATVARYTFDNPANPLENLGIGADAALLGGATISAGQLHVAGVDQALDIPLGSLSPFGGENDWRVAFDFATSGQVQNGALFSSDGSLEGGPFPGGQEGSLNIFLEGGNVVVDFWFIGAFGTDNPYNDDELHSVEVFYEAETGLVTLAVDDEEVSNDDDWIYARDATSDRTRAGDETNPDFGAEFNPNGFFGVFDNIVIDAPAPPPVLLTIDRDTGSMTLESISSDPITMKELDIHSGSGSLDSAHWLSIAENYDADSGGDVDANDNWAVTSATNFELAENDGGGDGATLASGQTIELGEGVWRPSPIEDVGVELFEVGLGEIVRGAIAYTGEEVLFADLDLDGDVDPADWDVFVVGYATDLEGASGYDAYFQADLNGDGEHTPDDFIEFVWAFDDFQGAGAFAALVGPSVPEPGAGAILLFSATLAIASANWRTIKGLIAPMIALAAWSLVVWPASAELLVEYRFDSGFQDTSGNNRHGIPVAFLGGPPSISGGRANFSGIPLSWLEVPLGDANPFDGSQDFTIEMTFNTLGSGDGGGGVILLGSADAGEPAAPDNHSLSIFIEPHEEKDGDIFGGSLVYDNFFVGEVRVGDALLLDGNDHTLKLTYTAPEEIDPDDPAPGVVFINLDGDWVTRGEIAPSIPNIANHAVTLGSTLNEDFPFECEEADCLTQELVGALDDVRIFDEAMAPSELRAVVNRETGEISILGGEFAQDIRFYEIRSAGRSLNPAEWNSLSDQGTDSLGGGSGESWDELAAAENRLTEGFLLGSSFFDEGRAESIGNGYNTSVDAQDLEIEVVNFDNERALLAIEYVGEPSAGIAGDFNGSGLVEQADLDLVLLNWGGDAASVPGTWINDLPTGIVDQAELDGVLLNWGDTGAAAESEAVPEPAGLAVAIAAIGGCWLLAPRRARRTAVATCC